MDLDGKTALVTGGSGDIGRAIAGALAAAGVDVAITYVGHLNEATAVADAVRAAGRRSLAVQLDQRDPAAINAAVDTAVRALGRLDILVNNAAWNIGIPFTDQVRRAAMYVDKVLKGAKPGDLPSSNPLSSSWSSTSRPPRTSGSPFRSRCLGGRIR